MEDDMEDIYALKTFKRNMKKFLDNDVGMDITLRFEDKEDRYYYIVAYDKQHMEFMRSADANNYNYNYNSDCRQNGFSSKDEENPFNFCYHEIIQNKE
ncbi:MAG: hypothetical protein J6M62_10465 [Selenomonadaceae bacterium]|nr:hypothetical protein [Selenomonadaceae bacterium]